MNLIQTDFLRYRLRYITSVASQHHSLRNTSPLQSLDRIFHTILDAICNDDRAQESAIFCHIYNCTYRIALRIRNSFLIHQLAIACQYHFPIDLNLHAMTGDFLGITYSALIQFLSPCIPDRP